MFSSHMVSFQYDDISFPKKSFTDGMTNGTATITRPDNTKTKKIGEGDNVVLSLNLYFSLLYTKNCNFITFLNVP